MWETIKTNLSAKIAVIFFVIYTLWFIYFHLPGVPAGDHYDWFTVTYGIIAAWGGIWGLLIAKRWGGFQSIMGKSIIFFSIGLLFQEIGQLAYSYYIYVLHIELPYPSLGDYFFWGTLPFYALGVIYLAKASGVHISLRSLKGKIMAFLVIVIALSLCYIVFLNGYKFDWSQPVRIFIDLGVPIGEAIYISFAVITYTLTRGILGGVMKSKVLFILIALLAEYIADWTFLYQASRGTWSVSGINDYMYFVAYFLMTFALIQLQTVYNKLQHKE